MSFSPPLQVQRAARQGLELRRKYRRGGTMVGVARARDLSNGRAVSLTTLKRMKSYFARHEVDKNSLKWNDPSAGKIAWLLWGGDSGRAWANGLLRKYVANPTTQLPTQCAWCKRLVDDDGEPHGSVLTVQDDYSHGVCNECLVKLLKKVKAKNPATKTVKLLSGPKPNQQQMEAEIRKQLGIGANDAEVVIVDPQGRKVTIPVDRVLNHVAFHPQDITRWHFIPAIVPTLEQPSEIYKKGKRPYRNWTYLSHLPVQGSSQIGNTFTAWVNEQDGDKVFGSIVGNLDAQNVENKKKTAGAQVYTRYGNPTGAWDTSKEDRIALIATSGSAFPSGAPIPTTYMGAWNASGEGKDTRLSERHPVAFSSDEGFPRAAPAPVKNDYTTDRVELSSGNKEKQMYKSNQSLNNPWYGDSEGHRRAALKGWKHIRRGSIVQLLPVPGKRSYPVVGWVFDIDDRGRIQVGNYGQSKNQGLWYESDMIAPATATQRKDAAIWRQMAKQKLANPLNKSTADVWKLCRKVTELEEQGINGARLHTARSQFLQAYRQLPKAQRLELMEALQQKQLKNPEGSTADVKSALEAMGYEVLVGKGGYWLKGHGFISLAKARQMVGIKAVARPPRIEQLPWGDYAIVQMLNQPRRKTSKNPTSYAPCPSCMNVIPIPMLNPFTCRKCGALIGVR